MKKAFRWAALAAVIAIGISSVGTMGATAGTKGKPFKLYLLVENKGESSTALPNYTDAANMAAEKLGNVELTRIPTALTASAAESSLLQAAPAADVMIGLTSSTQVAPLGTKLAQLTQGKPLITLNANPDFVLGRQYGASNIFLSLPIGDEVAAKNAEYLASIKPKIKKIGLLCVTVAFGTDSCNAAKKELAKQGIEVATEQSNGATATDLTQQVLAFKNAGVDAVLEFNFPNPMTVFSNQMAENGVNVPIFGAQSAPFAAASGSIQPGPLANLRGSDYCVPTSLKTKVAKKWVKDYQTKYGYVPTSSSAQAYDLVGLADAAVAKAKSTDPTKVTAALKSIAYDGVCGTYKADAGNGLWHTLNMISFEPGGTPKILKTLETGSVTETPAPTTTTTTVKVG